MNRPCTYFELYKKYRITAVIKTEIIDSVSAVIIYFEINQN